MRTMTFSKRCAQEILRDPINLCFGLGFPIVLLLLLSTMQKNIPNDLFSIQTLAPGITVFGLSFITLFSATLVAKDRESSFIQRLYTSPMQSYDFILGYTLPIIPIALMQAVVSYAFSAILGLEITLNTAYAILMAIPISIFYIALGLLCGSMLGVKQVGGICGALLTNVSAWLSGVWFDISLLGEGLEKVANALPFLHAVELEKHILVGDLSGSLPHLGIVLLYATVTTVGAVYLFLNQMKKQ